MGNLRLHRLLAVLLCAACQGQATTVVVDVASVVVSPSAASVEVGLTLQFMASAFDASGTLITGQSVSWESAVGGVATISSAGVATGVSAGSTEIRATIGGETGVQALTVNPSACGTRTSVTLSRGAHAKFAGNQCVLLPAGSAGDLYRVAIARPTLISADTTNVSQVTLQLSPVLTGAAATSSPAPGSTTALVPTRDDGPKIDGSRAMEHLRMMQTTGAFHNELRLRERALRLDPGQRLPNLASSAAAAPARVDPPATRNMFLGLTCSATAQRKAVRLISFDDNLAIYQETEEWNTNPISQADAAKMLVYFARYVKDMIVAYWGAVPDTDGNTRMIVVTSPSLGDGVAAAVYSGDFYPTVGTPQNSCAGSNEGEVIYFRGALIVALDDAAPDAFALGVVAHEAKHVISLYNGIQRGPNPPNFNELWIEEGTAVVSQVMSSRIAWRANGGPAVNERMTGTRIIEAVHAHGGEPTAEMSALVDALAGIVYSLTAQPNSVINDPVGAPAEHSFYSNSWHWHRLLGDAFGNAATAPYADSAFFRALTSPLTPAGGASGEIQLTGRSFDELFEDYVVAVSLHQTGQTPARAFTTWDFVSSANIFQNPNPPGSYPWPMTADNVDSWDGFASKSYAGPIGPSGVRFHDFRSSGTAGAQIHVTGANDGVIIVSRIN